MNISFTPERSKSIILIDDLEDYAVLFNTLTAETMGLNSTSLLVWNKIDGKRTIRDISKVISDNFLVEFEKAKEDVADLIGRMHRRMFIDLREKNHLIPEDRETD